MRGVLLLGYPFISAVEFGMRTMKFSDHPLTRRVDCADQQTCLRRMISDGDVVSISAPAYAKFIFNDLEYQGEMKCSCSLDENLIYGSLICSPKEIHC